MQIDASVFWSGSLNEGGSGTQRQQTILMVRWSLIIACAYLVLFSEGSSGAHGVGPVVIALFLGSNLIVGRLRPEVIATTQFNIVIAVLDTVLIATSLYLAGQLLVELVVLCLGVLVLAIAGFRPAVIAAATVGMTVASLVFAWLGGGESLLRSSMLLRVPFLLCAAIAYSWVTEAARPRQPAPAQPLRSPLNALAGDLGAQLEAVTRCQAAMSAGAVSAARAALEEIASKNHEMQNKLTDLPLMLGVPAAAAASQARSAA